MNDLALHHRRQRMYAFRVTGLRRVRFWSAVVALVSLLFTQLALANYDCPLPATPAPHPVAMQADMADCATFQDQQRPNLCDAHGQAKAQSPDRPAQPPVQPFVPAALVLAVSTVELALPPRLDAPAAFLQSAGSAPPISIRHCCLRN